MAFSLNEVDRGISDYCTTSNIWTKSWNPVIFLGNGCSSWRCFFRKVMSWPLIRSCHVPQGCICEIAASITLNDECTVSLSILAGIWPDAHTLPRQSFWIAKWWLSSICRYRAGGAAKKIVCCQWFNTLYKTVLEKGLRPLVLAINVSKFLPASRCSKRQLGIRSQSKRKKQMETQKNKNKCKHKKQKQI